MRKIDLVLEYIREHPGCRRSEIAAGVGISESQVMRYARQLTGTGKVQYRRVGPEYRLWVSEWGVLVKEVTGDGAVPRG